MTTRVEDDMFGNFSWSQITSTFDARGFVTARLMVFDDGRIRDEDYLDGVLVQVSWADPLDAVVWDTQTITFDPATGRAVTSSIASDNGLITDSTYAAGVLTQRRLTDSGNVTAWDSKISTYDAAGRIRSQLVTDDGGTTAQSSFLEGLRTLTTLTDVADVEIWATRVIDYDDVTGALLSITTTFDDGMIEVRGPATGPNGQTVTRMDDANVMDWTSQVSVFGPAGGLASRTVVFDDGTQSVTTMAGGARVSVVWTDVDNVFGWTDRSYTYDSAGRVERLVLLRDDGRLIERTFADGVIESRTITDTLDAFDFATISTTFDAAGRRLSHEVSFDNGVTVTSTYVDGILQDRMQADVDGNFGWDTIRTVFDDGALVYMDRTQDTGAQSFVDVRGLDVIAGGTDATVAEDAAPTLITGATIGLVDGYRGSGAFVPGASMMGSAGLGVFTLGVDGTWTYAALNNVAAIQGLAAGDRLTDSFVATTTDGVQTTVTVTIQGADDGPAPVYVGGDSVTVGAVGSLAGVQVPLDLATLFSDDQAETVSIAVTALPAIFSITDGVIGIVGGFNYLDPATYGEFAVAVTATDTDGNFTTQTVTLSLGVAHDFASDLAGANLWNQTFTDSDDLVELAAMPVPFLSFYTLDLGAGDDRAEFGDGFGESDSEVTITGGTGDDTVLFGADAGTDQGAVTVFGGAGRDTVTFGDNAALLDGQVAVFGGADDDTLTVGDMAGFLNGSVSLDGGSGADAITIGSSAGAAGGAVLIAAGTGADTVVIGTNAQDVMIDLGADTDVDTVTLNGTVSGLTLFRWTQGVDTITMLNQTGLIWAAQASGIDMAFISNDGQSFTVAGAAGVDVADIATGLTINSGPAYIGGVDPLADGVAGASSTGFSYDFGALFGDSDTALGDSLSVTLDAIPAGFTFINGVLAPITATDPSLAGSYTLVATATDQLAATTSETLSFDVLLAHDFGDDFACAATATVSGSDGADRATFGSGAASLSGHLAIELGAGADVVSFGTGAAETLGQLSIDLGMDSDADALIFNGTVENATITNWQDGVDHLVSVVDAASWTIMTVNSIGTVITDGTSTLSFTGINHLADASDFLI